MEEFENSLSKLLERKKQLQTRRRNLEKGPDGKLLRTHGRESAQDPRPGREGPDGKLHRTHGRETALLRSAPLRKLARLNQRLVRWSAAHLEAVSEQNQKNDTGAAGHLEAKCHSYAIATG